MIYTVNAAVIILLCICAAQYIHVCPSVTRCYWVKINEHRIVQFSPSGFYVWLKEVVYDLSNCAIFSDLVWPRFQGHTIVRRLISWKRCKIWPSLLWNTTRTTMPSIEWCHFQSYDWVIPNRDFKITFFQRQITRKWYNKMQLYLQ